MKLQSKESLDCLLLKALGRLSKSAPLSLLAEQTKSAFLTESVQLLRTPHLLKGLCHNQQLNNNTLVLLSSKGISTHNVRDCLFREPRSADQYSLQDSGDVSPAGLVLPLSYSLLSQHSASKLSSLTSLHTQNQEQVVQVEAAADSFLIASSPQDSLLVTAGKGKLQVMDLNSLETLHTLSTGSDALVVSLKFNNQGDRLGCVDSQGVFYLFRVSRNLRHSHPIHTLSSPRQVILDFAFTNNSSMFATVGQQPKPSLAVQDVLLEAPGLV